MGRIVYFLEGASSIGPEAVDELGLGYVRDGRGVARGHTAAGPSGGAGVLFAGSGVSLSDLGGVRWERYPGSDRLWLGFDPDDPPGPDDLQRRELLDGHPVRLGDGREWVVPVARAVAGTSPLPRRLRWDGRGWAPGEVLERYRHLWEAACSFWQVCLEAARDQEGDEVRVQLDQEADLACMALGMNYRIGPAEVSALGLLDTRCEAEACLAVVDWPTVKRLTQEGGLAGPFDGPTRGPGRVG